MSDVLYEHQCFKLTDRLKDMYQTSRSSKIFFERIYKKAMELPVGRFYRNSINAVQMSSQNDTNNSTETSLLFKEALFPLKIVMYFKELNSETELDKQECWTMVSCGYCKKRCE